jgi:hypothetical protein
METLNYSALKIIDFFAAADFYTLQTNPVDFTAMSGTVQSGLKIRGAD